MSYPEQQQPSQSGTQVTKPFLLFFWKSTNFSQVERNWIFQPDLAGHAALLGPKAVGGALLRWRVAIQQQQRQWSLDWSGHREVIFKL